MQGVITFRVRNINNYYLLNLNVAAAQLNIDV